MSSASDNRIPRGNGGLSFSRLYCIAGLFFALATISGGCRERSSLDIQSQTIQAADGISLVANTFVPRASHPPGLILVHRLGADRSGWTPFARYAQQAGYLVVTLDLRGHGESVDPVSQPRGYQVFTDQDWQDTLLDIDAARAQLLESGADPENLFIAGEALGASLALTYAVAHTDIQGTVLLSPLLKDKGMDAGALIARMVHRPTLLLWSEGDSYAATASNTLRRLAPGHTEAHTYAGNAHGTNLFSASPQSMGQIVVWLDQMLDRDAPGAATGGTAS